MKFLVTKPPAVNKNNKKLYSTHSSFGEARAEKLERKLESATKERQHLLRAEMATQISGNIDVSKKIALRGQIVERSIDRLQAAIPNERTK